MKCKICGVSVFNKPLYRTNQIGQSDAGWMCEDCIKQTEPELYKNMKIENEFQLSNDIKNLDKIKYN